MPFCDFGTEISVISSAGGEKGIFLFSSFSEHGRDYDVSCGVRINKGSVSQAPRGGAASKSGGKKGNTDGVGIVILDTGMGAISS